MNPEAVNPEAANLLQRAVQDGQRHNPAAGGAGGSLLQQPISAQLMQTGAGGSIEESALQLLLLERPDLLTILSQIRTPGGGDLKGNQAVHVHTAQQTYYFDLLLFEKGTDEATVRGRRDLLLQPGRTYVVRAAFDRNQYVVPGEAAEAARLWQHGICLERTLELYLEPETGGETATGVTQAFHGLNGQKASFTWEQRNDWKHEFTFTLPPGHPPGETLLRLNYAELGSGTGFKVASRLQVRLAGDAAAPAPESVQVLAAAAAQANMAFLYVQDAPDNHLQFQAWPPPGSDARPACPPPIPRPKLTRDPAAFESSYLEAVVDAISHQSYQDPAGITEWLDTLAGEQPGELRLVVIDLADTRLPWELLSLSEGRLGSQAVVVRWTEAYYKRKLLCFQPPEDSAAGRVVGYVHPPDAEEKARLFPQAKWLQEPGALGLALIPRPQEEVSLVYLGSAELLVRGDEADALAELRVRYPTTVRFTFAFPVGPQVRRPFFFVNAPYSALLFWRDRQGCGLAQAVLTMVGGGYIGLLGPMDPDLFRQAARDLFQEAATPAGVQPAQFLRRLRAEAEAELGKPGLTEAQYEEQWRRLKAYCMLVYYGHPDARLRVATPPAAAPPAGGPDDA